MPRLATAVLVPVLVVCAGVASASVRTEPTVRYDRSFPVTGRPALVLRADDAGVSVDTWDRAAVGIRVTTRGWSIPDRDVVVEVAQSGDQVRCEVRERPHWGFFVLNVRSIHVDVRLPREADVDLSTGDGSVTLAPLAGEILVHTGDGAIEAEGLRGQVTLTTGDGHIEATALDGALVARSGDGRIRLDGRFDRLEVGTSDGGVEAVAREGSRLASAWDLHSGDGSVTLRVPATLRADLDLRTGDGRLVVDLPVEVRGELGRRSLNGRLNGGGLPLRVRSGDGSIRLERL